jgi:hypothetical protein
MVRWWYSLDQRDSYSALRLSSNDMSVLSSLLMSRRDSRRVRGGGVEVEVEGEEEEDSWTGWRERREFNSEVI